MLTFSDDMSFGERWYNTMLGIYDGIVRRYVYLPAEEELASSSSNGRGYVLDRTREQIKRRKTSSVTCCPYVMVYLSTI